MKLTLLSTHPKWRTDYPFLYRMESHERFLMWLSRVSSKYFSDVLFLAFHCAQNRRKISLVSFLILFLLYLSNKDMQKNLKTVICCLSDVITYKFSATSGNVEHCRGSFSFQHRLLQLAGNHKGPKRDRKHNHDIVEWNYIKSEHILEIKKKEKPVLQYYKHILCKEDS